MRVRVPGKLMLAGEYAVLAPGATAVALAVRRHLTVHCRPGAWAELSSPAIGLAGWPLRDDRPTGDRVVDAAVSVARAFLRSEGLALAPRHFVVASALGGGRGPKPGLGSSAAATVGLIAALLAASGADVTGSNGRHRVRGLALLGHLRAQGFRGSGYDVATCVEGGVVAVHAPDDVPLATRAHDAERAAVRPETAAAALADAQRVTAFTLPDGLALGLVSTGRSASTPALVHSARAADPTPLAEAARAVIDALTGSPTALLHALAAAQAAFEAWDEAHGLGLMTDELRTLAAQARAAGITPRVSGAGGGDSLVVLTEDAAALECQLAAWRKAGRPAEVIEVDDRGLSVEALGSDPPI